MWYQSKKSHEDTDSKQSNWLKNTRVTQGEVLSQRNYGRSLKEQRPDSQDTRIHLEVFTENGC